MKQCPTCGRAAEVLIIDVSDGSEFCHECAPSTFLPHYVLTFWDIGFMRSCGIDAEIPEVLRSLVKGSG